jgi:hypothetical protein
MHPLLVNAVVVCAVHCLHSRLLGCWLLSFAGSILVRLVRGGATRLSHTRHQPMLHCHRPSASYERVRSECVQPVWVRGSMWRVPTAWAGRGHGEICAAQEAAATAGRILHQTQQQKQEHGRTVNDKYDLQCSGRTAVRLVCQRRVRCEPLLPRHPLSRARSLARCRCERANAGEWRRGTHWKWIT